MKNYNLDGTEHNKAGFIAPIVLIESPEGSDKYPIGWYFCDEVEQLHGPFNTFEETVELFKSYCTEAGHSEDVISANMNRRYWGRIEGLK